MRKLAVTQNITMDGRIDMLGDWFVAQHQDAELLAENARQRDSADAVLLGRDTFESMRGYWRDLVDDSTGVSDYLNRVDKYVVSSTLTQPAWRGTTVLGGDWLDSVRKLKATTGGDIVCTGSVSLTHALFEAGLVDEIRLFRYPVVQGEGRYLFPDNFSIRHARVAEAAAWPGGTGYERWALS